MRTAQEPPSFPPGAIVDVRGERWRVLETVDHGACNTCRLTGAGSSNIGRDRSLLLPFDRPRPVSGPIRWKHASRRGWIAALRALMAADATALGLRGAAAARIDLLAYQAEPALACAHGATRLLLADEVGLGKTIQAGLIIADLFARTEWPSVLVVCPASLCGQWQQELADRFGLPAAVADLGVIRRQFRYAAVEEAPWNRLPLPVASVDFVKRPEVLQAMSAVRWDLLVVDEAHLCAAASERAAGIDWLARRSRRVVLLTATPHAGERESFEALCRVGRLAGEDPILLFRRTRAGLGLPSERRVHVLRVRLSPAERRLHAALRRYASSVWKAGEARPGATEARLAMIVLTKRAASGPGPVLASLERRRALLDRPADAGAMQMRLPLEEPDQDQADEEPAAVLAVPGLAHRATELAVLDRLISLARAALARDSKLRAVLRLLRRVRQPAIVFTEYRDALERVLRECEALGPVAVIHGGLDLRARAGAVDAFTSGRAPLLLATDAAAHGLNLQERCRLVVNLDLPWNPVRLEQRVGRVDRIGQRRVVHAINVIGRGSVETLILERLTARMATAREALGNAADVLGTASDIATAESLFSSRPPRRRPPSAESEVLAARRAARRRSTDVLACAPGSRAPESTGAGRCFDRADFSRQAQLEVERLNLLRQLRAPRGGSRPRAVAQQKAASWSVLGLRRTPPFDLVAVFIVDVVDGNGRLLEQLLVPVSASLGRPWPQFGVAHRDSAVASTARTIEAVLARFVAQAADERLRYLASAIQPRVEAERLRERALWLVVDDDSPPVQPGLFDRRALRDAEAAAADRARLSEEGALRLRILDGAGRPRLARPPRIILFALAHRR